MNGPQWDNGDNCGRTVSITNPNTGLSTKATVTNSCMDCAEYQLDMCHSLFGYLTNDHWELGEFQMTWCESFSPAFVAQYAEPCQPSTVEHWR